MTGSNTNSNVVFGQLQQETALVLALSVPLILAAQTTGGAIGSLFAPAKVIGQGAEYRCQPDDQQAGAGIYYPQPEGRYGALQRCRPVLFEKQREKPRHDDHGKRGISPIIKCPGQLASFTDVHFSAVNRYDHRDFSGPAVQTCQGIVNNSGPSTSFLTGP